MALSQNHRYGWRPDVPDPRDMTFKAHRKSPVVRLPSRMATPKTANR